MATLEEIDAKLDILLGQAGSNTVLFTVLDSDSQPIAGVGIIVDGYTGALVGVSMTNAAGQASMKLDASTYFVFLRKVGSGFIFDNAYTVVVTGPASVTLMAANVQQASPSDPSVATVWGYVTDLGLAAQANLKIIAELITSNVLTLGGTVLGNPIQVFTDAAGFFTLELPVGGSMIPGDAIYRISVEAANNRMGWERPIKASRLAAGGSYHLGSLV